jgi:hypothetical protein
LEVIYLQSKKSIRQERNFTRPVDEALKLTGIRRVDSQPKTSVTARWILEQDMSS